MTKEQSNKFRILILEAMIAGRKAVDALVSSGRIVPMVVVEHTNPLDDKSPIARVYPPVMDGACGFAWVKVRPGNSAFAKWLVAQGKTERRSEDFLYPDGAAYDGGVDIWITVGNQSVAKKETYADAFTQVLRKAGIRAYAASRLD